jgi:carbon monoxide dehydrogenase subunit G
LHRHKTNCLRLASSNQIKKEAARGSAAVALLPTKETLSSAYSDLRTRIDQIVEQAQQEGSLNVAISGLNSIRQTLDSLARLAGHLQPASTQVNVAVQTNVNVGAMQIAERLIQKFDHEPELKARIAQALVEEDHEHGS